MIMFFNNKNNGNSDNGRISHNKNSNSNTDTLQMEWHGVKKTKQKKEDLKELVR